MMDGWMDGWATGYGFPCSMTRRKGGWGAKGREGTGRGGGRKVAPEGPYPAASACVVRVMGGKGSEQLIITFESGGYLGFRVGEFDDDGGEGEVPGCLDDLSVGRGFR